MQVLIIDQGMSYRLLEYQINNLRSKHLSIAIFDSLTFQLKLEINTRIKNELNIFEQNLFIRLKFTFTYRKRFFDIYNFILIFSGQLAMHSILHD